MRRDAIIPQFIECRLLKIVQEERLDIATTKFTRWQRDAMDHDETDVLRIRALIEVRRIPIPNTRQTMILFDSQNEYSAMHYNSLCSCSHETKAADNFLPGSLTWQPGW